MDNNKRLFCGSGRIIKTKYGEMPVGSHSEADLVKMLDYLKDNGLKYVNWKMIEKREKVEGKPTHYLEIDDWKPTAKETLEVKPVPESDDLPF